MHSDTFIAAAKRTIQMEVAAINVLESRIDSSFAAACSLLLGCQGRVIVSGMGKSGHIGNKIAATLASTGTPAFFVHPGEASHGDLGMITPKDVVLAISNSGTSAELITLLPVLKRMGTRIISMTGNPESPLAQAAEIHLDIGVETEACPLDLAPTSSTTVTLVMGDALAVALLEARGFTAEDFAFSHPGGALGRKLLLKVEDIMHKDTEVPVVSPSTPLARALVEMTEKGFGITTVVNDDKQLVGVFTDGDLRRHVDLGTDLSQAIMTDVMTRNPKTVSRTMLAVEALNLMESTKITAAIVADEQHGLTGIIHLHDLLRAGVV
ncbi:KpsF/GutQ family sugar-phosphate isomerase [Halioxenophilus sp. WMMB6]|uniref:KpsF/GutQ family sugar-phosphate isomerase n=1 Tax=Halioxenophilus sp. WMMB6 TaxID=3073815 RepID=UPI00295F0AF0|nr:KpsF/GutQ family sugar-phosphate isomerase [Halioxenophilus sp. WMMB6]